MLETVVLLNIVWDLWYLKKKKKVKNNCLFKIEILCYNIHYSKYTLFFFLFKDTLKEFKES